MEQPVFKGLIAALTLTSVIAFAGTPGISLPVQDGDFACLDPARAARYVSDFGINVESFGGLELCDSHVDTKKLFNDLQIIEEGRFDGNRGNLFIKNFVPKDGYLNWLRQETRGVERGNDVPYATAYNSGGYFTMQDGWAHLSTLGRVGTIIHEARHTEGYYHTYCEHGPYLGTRVSGCDESVDEGGSHAIEMEYYARVVVQGANFHPVYQAMARLMLLARSNFVFNANPLAMQDALLARTDTGLARFQNGARQDFQWGESSPGANSVMKHTSFGASMFELPGVATAIDLKNGTPATLLPDVYSYFKLTDLSPIPELRDLEEVDLGHQRYFVGVDAKSNLFSYIYGDGEWSRPTPLDGAVRFVTTDPFGHDGAYVLLANGTYCPLDPRQLNCREAARNWPPQARNFVQFSGQTLRLDTTGRVTVPDGSLWDGLKDEHVLDLVKIPAYNVFESDMNY